MTHHVAQRRARFAQILPRVEVIGMLGKVLADHTGERQAQVRVDIDFAHCHGRRLAQHLLGHALGIAQLAAKLVDHLHILGHYRRSAMKHNGKTGKPAAHLFEDVKAQFGLALELISTVAGANGDGKGVTAGTFHKLLHLLGAGIG